MVATCFVWLNTKIHVYPPSMLSLLLVHPVTGFFLYISSTLQTLEQIIWLSKTIDMSRKGELFQERWMKKIILQWYSFTSSQVHKQKRQFGLCVCCFWLFLVTGNYFCSLWTLREGGRRNAGSKRQDIYIAAFTYLSKLTDLEEK